MRKNAASNRSRFAAMALLIVLGTTTSCGYTGASSALSSMPDAASGTGATSSPAAPHDLEPISKRRLSPVYWLCENDSTVYLYREYAKVPDVGDPIVAALESMLAGRPRDPDYFSLWRPASAVGASIDADNVITIDLSRDAFGATMDSGLARRSIAQLVFTATAAAANAGILTKTKAPRVRLLVDGQSGYRAFGHVELPELIDRDYSLRAPIWVIDPQQNTTVGSNRITIKGDGASFSGGNHWQIQELPNADSASTKVLDAAVLPVIDGGPVPAGGPELGADAFLFERQLAPGNYRLSVWGQEAGSADRLAADTKDFSVS